MGALRDEVIRLADASLASANPPADIIRKYIEEHGNIAALVLATSAEGNSGPLVNHFAATAGNLPCPLYLIPGGISKDELDALA